MGAPIGNRNAAGPHRRKPSSYIKSLSRQNTLRKQKRYLDKFTHEWAEGGRAKYKAAKNYFKARATRYLYKGL